MQELTTAPQTTSPYTPAGGSNMPALTAAQPKLGTPIPGTTGGLAAKPGLTVYDNPLSQQLQSNPQQSAQQAQSYGRGEDTMLIHMTPEEVNSLQGLAMAHGGSLTINPHTGLPEAGWLGKLLPTILGAVGMAFGIPPIWMGVGGAAVGTAITGDLGKGLSMGLQAYGGASLGGAAGIGGKLGHLGADIGLKGAEAAVMHPAALSGGSVATQSGNSLLGSAIELPNLPTPTLAGNIIPAAGTGATSGMGGFGAAAKAGLGSGMLSKAAVPLAISGALGGLSEANAPNLPKYTPEKQTPYVPMGPGKREVMYQTPDQMRESGGAEFSYFTPSNPAPVPLAPTPMDIDPDNARRFADGGDVGTPASFEDLVAYFGASNPGAISASPYPTSAAATQPVQAQTQPTVQAPVGGGETVYNFTNRSPNQTAPVAPLSPSYGTYPDGLGNIFGIDWNAIYQQYGNTSANTAPAAPVVPLPEQVETSRPSWLGREPTAPVEQVETSRPSWLGREPTEPAPIETNTPSWLGREPTEPAPIETNTPSWLGREPTAPVEQVETSRPSWLGREPTAPVEASISQPAYTPEPVYDTLPAFTPERTFGNAPSYLSESDVFTPEPVFTPQPTYTPEPVFTPQPTYTPEPVFTPQPTYSAAPVYDYGMYPPMQDTYVPSYGYDYDYGRSDMFPSFGYDYASSEGFGANMYAKGGDVNMQNGSFVLDARTVSELGNGSSNAGKELLARLGGKPLDGPGDGVSDSIPARIGGSQKARVARDEVIMPPAAVRRIGGGDEKRGTQKLYALMDKAHKARKTAKRGQDTKLAKGLGALA